MPGGNTPSSEADATVSDFNWQITQAADFNGDGKADLLWRHIVTGQVYLWLMDGAAPLSFKPVATVADLNWQIAQAADVNGDVKADLLWRHAATGQVCLGRISGATPIAS